MPSDSIPQAGWISPGRPEAKRFFPTANSFPADRKEQLHVWFRYSSNRRKCIRLSQTSAGRQDKEERRLQQLPMWIPQTDTNFHNTCGEEDRWEEAQCHTVSLQSSSIPAKAVESAERFVRPLAPSALSIGCHSWGAKQVGVPVPTPDCHCNLCAVRGDGRSKGHQEAAKAADQAASRPPAGRQQASLSALSQDCQEMHTWHSSIDFVSLKPPRIDPEWILE